MILRGGTRKRLWSWFATCRVIPRHEDGTPADEREELWLLIEWPPDESESTKYTLCTLPKRTSRHDLVWMTKEHGRTERVYEDMKGELGLDHFEGRRSRVWHHHVSVALCCYAFIVAEHARSPPLGRPVPSHSYEPARGPNATSRTGSSRFASPSCAASHGGSRGVRYAITRTRRASVHPTRASVEGPESDPVVLATPTLEALRRWQDTHRGLVDLHGDSLRRLPVLTGDDEEHGARRQLSATATRALGLEQLGQPRAVAFHCLPLHTGG